LFEQLGDEADAALRAFESVGRGIVARLKLKLAGRAFGDVFHGAKDLSGSRVIATAFSTHHQCRSVSFL
jgi:hypothetical protein